MIDIPLSQRQRMANAIRMLSVDAVQKAKSGHPGMPMGMADAATALFADHLNFDPNDPEWPNRDRFILSAGHGSMLLYSLLYLTGYEHITIEEIRNFRQWRSNTPGHPERNIAHGIEVTTGPLGQGLANAVGMAIAEQKLNNQFGEDAQSHYTYAIAGDGCLMEGISHEAISLAGQLQLGKLVVLFDNNSISIDGDIDLSCDDDQLARFSASKWHVQEVDGHNQSAISDAIAQAKLDARPSLISVRTTIGYGSPNMKGTSKVHGSPLGDDEIALVRQELDWNYPPFEVPGDVKSLWEATAERGIARRAVWEATDDQIKNIVGSTRQDNSDAVAALDDHCQDLERLRPSIASRQASQQAIAVVFPHLTQMIGGSADLTGSNLTKVAGHKNFTASDRDGNYIHYGVREHGMAAAMNGIALHGGLSAYGGTFLIFSDYMRGAIRLAALMKTQVIYVLTHDSIGVGEDGPTHQPVESLAALRCIQGLQVLRPADALETAQAWKLALETTGPSAICLSRQSLPYLERDSDAPGDIDNGAIVISDRRDGQIDLIGTGSEVALCVEAAAKLASENIAARVISMPCVERFLEQPVAIRSKILSKNPRIIVEAASHFGWDRLLRENDSFVGMNSYGASAPAARLYKEFGITADAIVARAKEALEATST